MRSKILIVILMLVLGTGFVIAQDSLGLAYRNAVKVNLAATAFRKLTVNYERQVSDRWSYQLAAGYKFGGKVPRFIGLGDLVLTSESGGLRGFSVTPDVRYHFQNCKCDGRTGLYAGLYMNATKLYGDLVFNYWNGTDYIDVGGVGSLREYGIGLELGYQFVFKERWLVDLMFMGPRTSFQRLKVGLDSDFAADIIPRIEEEINKRLEWWGMDPISIEPDADAVVDFRFNNFRYAISFGFLF